MTDEDLKDLAIITASTSIAVSSLVLLKKLEEEKEKNYNHKCDRRIKNAKHHTKRHTSKPTKHT